MEEGMRCGSSVEVVLPPHVNQHGALRRANKSNQFVD